MNALDDIAKVRAKDCFLQGKDVVFVIPSDQMSRAIGKKGATIELLKKRLGKRIELFEHSDDPQKFFEKAFNAKMEKIEVRENDDHKIVIISADGTNKRIILQNMGRLKKIKEIAKRNYKIEEVRIR